MMKKIAIRILTGFLALSVFSGQAQSLPSFEACVTPGTEIGFSNGISTLRDFASTQSIKVAFRAKSLPSYPSLARRDAISFYHKNNDFGDFAEVFLQKAQESQFDSINFSEKSQTFFYGLAGIASFGPVVEMFKDLFARFVVPAMLGEANNRVAQEVALDLKKAQEVFVRGNSLLIVAHSQGTLYSNELVRQLYAIGPAAELDGRLSLVSAGVAASYVAGKGGAHTRINYVTNAADSVINGLRLASVAANFLQPLPFNVASVSPTTEGVLDSIVQHSFQNVYFNESLDSGKMVVALMADRLTDLANYSNLQQGEGASKVAYTLRSTLTFPTSVEASFAETKSVPLEMTGPFASSVQGRVSYRDSYSVTLEASLMCSGVDGLVQPNTPMLMEFASFSDGSVPTLNGTTLSRGLRETPFTLPDSAVSVKRLEIDGLPAFGVSFFTGYLTKGSDGKSISVSQVPGQ